ncbi:histidine phosphatase family protein [Alteromonas lipolytica]|uniref:Histidine phosphatase family protein n=1 Tax=Alteromonas lipolytica TaxID=1856405 RepID=A0A1E8FI53_9ALTE|nr:histidine phosphatase family protein [Alteromonas lipolytica]OFI35620.1 hypothetical protein BFC17_12765 [Alteromonas lipolytica]GGF77670.1 phosphoglycerate mutase [Alteromonas lipolytica]
MAEIILLRHGQASLGAANYDQLSPVGYQQAELLGRQWANLALGADKLVLGSMARHEQTATAFLKGLSTKTQVTQPEVCVDGGLNEYDFQNLLDSLKAQYPQSWHDTGNGPRDYYHNIKAALLHWANGDIADDGHCSWEGFKSRILTALESAMASPFRRLVLVTSGGPTSMLLGHFLGLDATRTINLSLRIKNTSTSTIITNRTDFTVESVNDVSHLMTAEHCQLITVA